MRRGLAVLALLCAPLAFAGPADALVCADVGQGGGNAYVEVCVTEKLCLVYVETSGSLIPNVTRCVPLPAR